MMYNLFKVDTIIIIILGVALSFISPDLQTTIVAGLIGYLSRGEINADFK